jgi:hypothetical protein
MICSSENLLLRIVRLLSGGYGLYPNLEEIEGLRSTVDATDHYVTANKKTPRVVRHGAFRNPDEEGSRAFRAS